MGAGFLIGEVEWGSGVGAKPLGVAASRRLREARLRRQGYLWTRRVAARRRLSQAWAASAERIPMESQGGGETPPLPDGRIRDGVTSWIRDGFESGCAKRLDSSLLTLDSLREAHLFQGFEDKVVGAVDDGGVEGGKVDAGGRLAVVAHAFGDDGDRDALGFGGGGPAVAGDV